MTARWFLYSCAVLVAEVLALILAPILPLFAVHRFGPWDNNSQTAMGHRLPKWLAWFDTPDNSLEGDHNWQAAHFPVTYWSMVGWLLRNRAYGFKWSVLSAPMVGERVIEGDPLINYHTGRYGTLKIKMGDYWQWKCIKPIGGTGYCLMMNFGWLLDDPNQNNALFMFSPRVVRAE